tara:strand:- start:1454 stop:1861 length:408 start_codon:yes stop_codon:yes gene_type:complete
MPIYWNTETTKWNEYSAFWNAGNIVPIVSGDAPGYAHVDEYLKKENLNEQQFIKIYLTVHNQFLTEEQKKLVKIAKSYPTYNEQQYIKENVNIILENLNLKEKQKLEELPKKIKIENIKIGLEKIIDHVTYNTPK